MNRRRLRAWLATPELIGAPNCPIIRRWTIVSADKPTTSPPQGAFPLLRLPTWATGDRKLMVHHFLPNVEDRDPHDHPRSFTSFVLRGRYEDLVPCAECGGNWERIEKPAHVFDSTKRAVVNCLRCHHGLVVGDVMAAGTIRHRASEHAHVTRTGAEGAWTIVLMGPLARAWGFWRDGRWYAGKKYEALFGFAMRCPSDEDREGELLKYSDDMVPRGAASE